LYVTAQRSIALAPDTPPIGDRLRATPPHTIAGKPVVSYDDLKLAVRHHQDGTTEPLTWPSSDVLIYHLQDGARVIVRPSGTEPKLKCYYEVVGTFAADESFAEAELRAEEQMALLISEHQNSLV
jgi:phosphomannomutase